MKKIIFGAACLAMTGLYATAQHKHTAPPPPPPPPVVSTPMPPPALPVFDLPAPPPPPSLNAHVGTNEVTIINSNGAEITVTMRKGIQTVVIRKDGKIQKIKMDTWNANRKYYEKKFGHLPPPPPAIPRIELKNTTTSAIE